MFYFYFIFYIGLFLFVFYYPFCALSKAVCSITTKPLLKFKHFIPVYNMGCAYRVFCSSTIGHYLGWLVSLILIITRLIIMFTTESTTLWSVTAIGMWVALAFIYLDAVLLCITVRRSVNRFSLSTCILILLLPSIDAFILATSYKMWYKKQLEFMEKNE